VCGATEDEQPVHFLQTSQLDLTQWACLLEPAEALLDQPSPAQANGIAGLTRGSAVQVAAAAVARVTEGSKNQPNLFKQPGPALEKSAEWTPLKGLVRIESERYHKATGKTEREIRCYINSLRPDAAC